MKKLEDFLQQAQSSLSTFDRYRFTQVYEYAEELYHGLVRFSGESYLDHALRVAYLLLPLKIDQVTLMAALLVNAHKSPLYNLDEIESLFGLPLRKIVEGLERLNAINSRHSHSHKTVIRKLFLSIAEDLRAIIIRLAERIENMDTLSFVPSLKQKAIARETLNIYVPIAARLGLYHFKCKLEDLAFKFLFPVEYETFKKEMEEYTSQYAKNIEETRVELEQLMKENHFKVMVSGRVKNLFSVYNKLKKKSLTSLSDLYDIYAMRIIVLPVKTDGVTEERVSDLYAILSLLHSRYQPDLDRFKDYVVNPKKNGYQSLHTTVVGISSIDKGKPVEIQIRTESMHQVAESGFAAHWLYKDKNDFSIKNALDKDLEILQEANVFGGELTSRNGKLSKVKFDFYKDRIFVLTPNNQVKDLPKDSTPVDFAYAVHTDVGHSCYLAKVNGAVVPLDYKLQNGQVVEIVITPKPGPKLSWLGFVKTRLAKNRIKSFFKALNRKSLFEEGRDEFNLLLTQLSLPLLDEDLSLLKIYHGKRISLEDRQKVLEDIGAGHISPSIVFKNIKGEAPENLFYPSHLRERNYSLSILPQKNLKKEQDENAPIIAGERNLPFRISECCKPKLSMPIVAYLTRAKGISIHSKNCKFIHNADISRLLDAHWGNEDFHITKSNYNVGLVLEIKERKGYLEDIIRVSNENSVKILEFRLVKKEDGIVVRRLIVDVLNQLQLEKIIGKLILISGILKVSRL